MYKEFYIKINDQFVEELEQGYTLTHLEDATEFTSIKDLLHYAKAEGIKGFTTFIREHKIEETEYVLVGDMEWVDIDDCFECDVCGEWNKQENEFVARYELGASVCPSCREDGN